jgi:hypothetical protein
VVKAGGWWCINVSSLKLVTICKRDEPRGSFGKPSSLVLKGNKVIVGLLLKEESKANARLQAFLSTFFESKDGKNCAGAKFDHSSASLRLLGI